MLNAFTKVFFAVYFICIASLLSAQTDVTGHWQVVSTTDYSAEPVLYGKLDFTDHTLHFGENGRLVINSEEGQFIGNYRVDNGIISYHGTTLTILEQQDKELILVFEDAASHRYLELTLRPAKKVPEKIASLLAYPDQEKYGVFPTQGVYHRFDEDSNTHRYTRFLPDGRLFALTTSTELTDFNYLNGAYVLPHDRQIKLNKKNYRAEVVAGIHLNENSFQKSEFSYQLLEDGNKLERHQRAENLRDGKIYTKDHVFTFIPLPDLAYWLPNRSAVSQEEKEYPFIHTLLASKPRSAEEEVFRVVSQMPMFPCGKCKDMEPEKARKMASGEMLKYVYSNINYPAQARKDKIEGTVIISFIINTDGTVSDAEIRRDIGGGCGEEALRVIQNMNADGIRWQAGKARGIPVRVHFNMPIKFSLN